MKTMSRLIARSLKRPKSLCFYLKPRLCVEYAEYVEYVEYAEYAVFAHSPSECNAFQLTHQLKSFSVHWQGLEVSDDV